MPDRMSEDMPDRNPNRMPIECQKICRQNVWGDELNAMVGITRSKVFCCVCFSLIFILFVSKLITNKMKVGCGLSITRFPAPWQRETLTGQPRKRTQNTCKMICKNRYHTKHISRLYFLHVTLCDTNPLSASCQEACCTWAKSKSLRYMLLGILVRVGSWALGFRGYTLAVFHGLSISWKENPCGAFLFSLGVDVDKSHSHHRKKCCWPFCPWIGELVLSNISSQGPCSWW